MSDLNGNGDATEFDSITIAGRQFEVPVPYNEGHVLTAGEARQFNQTFHEHIRNNTASKIKDLMPEEAQKFVTEYAGSFEFGERKAGGGPRAPSDPVGRMAYQIVRERLIAALKAPPHSYKNPVKELGAEFIAAEIKRRVDAEPQWKELARTRIEENKSLTFSLDTVAATPAQAAE